MTIGIRGVRATAACSVAAISTFSASPAALGRRLSDVVGQTRTESSLRSLLDATRARRGAEIPPGPHAAAVATLHAESWRRHYRGAYSDAFLDGDVFADRLAVWTKRLREADPRRCTILAEDESLVGFANTAASARVCSPLTAEAVMGALNRPVCIFGFSNRTPALGPSTRPAAGDA